ncbi:hypothetical protein [Nonomuraea sp. SBT364]|uniref:hypothetical protein n=1 Tax=Nonomuraea sp. SBT364 TaxID=1580530 RepID=UPI000A902B5D|nr:hypothetical protein [Nonomuraea sp. SBT364]
MAVFAKVAAIGVVVVVGSLATLGLAFSGQVPFAVAALVATGVLAVSVIVMLARGPQEADQ